MTPSTLILALGATLAAGATSAAPITVLNAEPAARETPAARCRALPASTNGADVECVVTLGPGAAGAQAPSRILIRTEVGQARCVAKAAEVVRLSASAATPQRLPLVEHAGGGRTCGS